MRRLHRVRANPIIRDLLNETSFGLMNMIQPIFVIEGLQQNEPLPGLRFNERLTQESVLRQVEHDLAQGVRNFLFFFVPAQKSDTEFPFRFAAETISAVKKQFGSEIAMYVDTCLCSSTAHGHCCLFDDKGKMNLPGTLEILASQARIFADAGADGISPSDMMDGRVAAIRQRLDNSGHTLVPIMSYSTKFASSFYGPFRHAADSAPQFGDRRAYQIDVRNRSDALAASVRCAEEGADMLMVKPGMTAIDLIAPIRDRCELPVGAYQVSGEYASLCLLDENKLGVLPDLVAESMHVFRRSGAQYVITYAARMMKEWKIYDNL